MQTDIDPRQSDKQEKDLRIYVLLRGPCLQCKHGHFEALFKKHNTVLCFFFSNSANKCRRGGHKPVNTRPHVISALHKDIFHVLHLVTSGVNGIRSTDLFHLPTLMHNSLFINNMYVTLQSSTCFEH